MERSLATRGAAKPYPQQAQHDRCSLPMAWPSGCSVKHAIICLREELRALSDARRSLLADGWPRTAAPNDCTLGQLAREIGEVKQALELITLHERAAAAVAERRRPGVAG
jgi:hypothetical protein